MTQTRSLPRWSRTAVVAAIGLMCAALILVVWTTQRSVRDARSTLLRGQAAEANAVVRARMMELEDAPLAERVVAAYDAASAAQRVRYLAALDPDDSIAAEAGVPSSDHAALARWVASAAPGEPVRIGDRIRVVYKRTRKPTREETPPQPPAGAQPRRSGPVATVLEIDTAKADELDAAATWSRVIGTASAATLLVLAIVLVRLSLRREDAVRAAEQARHLASLGQMSAVLAHEIRNPLASLKGNAQLLARSLPEGEKPRAKADRVVDEAVRLEHLTNDLLAFARSGEIKVADADPGALLRDAAAAVGSDASRIKIDDGAAPRSWPLDADRMRQVLVNLLENAAEMSEGPIEAAVERDGAELRFTVRDHGPGLPAADLERLFEPFFTKRTRSTGLGLAVCKRLVDLHGGTIAARNVDGGGAEFSIALPRGAA